MCCRSARMPYGMAFNTPVTSSTRIFPISAARLSLPSRVGTAAMSAGIALMPSTKLMAVRGRVREGAPPRRAETRRERVCDEPSCDLRGGHQNALIFASRVLSLLLLETARLSVRSSRVGAASNGAPWNSGVRRTRNAVDCPRRQSGSSRVRVDASRSARARLAIPTRVDLYGRKRRHLVPSSLSASVRRPTVTDTRGERSLSFPTPLHAR